MYATLEYTPAMMRTLLLVSMACFGWLGAAAAAAPPRPVESVDLARYAGTWYEIARVPNRFQKNCARGVTATYRLREDGRIDVINRCERADGSVDEAGGVARIVDELTRARLEVSFVRLFGQQLFWGDYWVLGLDPEYGWAVVGTPDRKYGWILARSTNPGPEVIERVFAVLRSQGYRPEDFRITPH